MQYRKFGKLDWKVSALGFGAMRLPLTKPSDASSIKEDEAIKMMRYAIDHGVNYVDTAYPYHGGQSEKVVGKMLKDGYRDKVKLATKLPTWMISSAADFDRVLDEQLERLQTNIDFYLLHGLNSTQWPRMRDMGVIKWAEKAMAKGRFNYLCFSFHDDNNVFTEIVDAYDNWKLAQIQYNFLDEDYQAGRKGLKYAAGKNIAMVIMEPLRGGGLTLKPPEQIASLWASAAKQRSLAEWGLLWVWNQPEVSVVLSGMSTMEQVVENVEIASRSRVNLLTKDELALYKKVADVYNDKRPIPCTGCKYCMPCPHGVNIPGIFELYNDGVMWGNMARARQMYNSPMGIKEKERGNMCAKDKECVEKCPQGIDIPEWLEKIHLELAKK
jgi:hypothetical protein